MQIKLLTFYSTVLVALSLPAVVEANQTQAAHMVYASSDIFSVANSFTSFDDDYPNANLSDGGLNVNNAITSLEYTKDKPLDVAYLNNFLQNEDSQDTNFTKLGYSRSHEAFLSAISRVSSYGKDNFVNYAVSSISRNIEVGPEPETYSMMFAGLILMAFVARRRTN
jgi:hypothetical protein